jgi:hypothetical protein
MANYTIAQLRTVGINPAGTDFEGTPGTFYVEYEFDGSKRSTVANDTADLFEFPAYAGVVIEGAAITTVKAGTASSTFSITLGAAAAAGTAVTGLTAWAADAAAGTKLVKLATAANSLINTTASGFIKLQVLTGGAGAGKYRVRVFGRILEAASAT